MHFVFNYYAPTTAPFIGFFIYTAITKRNRFILHSALPGRDNTVRILLFGFLVGFVMAIHTAWNFTQNFIFGLPNSGLVSEASIFALDAANAKTSWIYSASFGVEGGIPSLIADGALGVICLILAARKGRLGELGQRGVK